MVKKTAFNGQNALSKENPAKVQVRQGQEVTIDWARAHGVQIAQYNAWVAAREPYSQRVRRWRDQEQPEVASKSAL